MVDVYVCVCTDDILSASSTTTCPFTIDLSGFSRLLLFLRKKRSEEKILEEYKKEGTTEWNGRLKRKED